MRCNNCGFMNPQGRVRCDKCNAPLSGSMVDPVPSSVGGTDDGLAGTIKGGRLEVDPWDCPTCGRPLIPGAGGCSQCGAGADSPKPTGGTLDTTKSGDEDNREAKFPSKDQEIREFRKQGLSPKGTIDPYQKGFRLKPIATEYETEMEQISIRAVSDTVELGRENLEPDNGTISTKQAGMVNKNGKWYIKDESRHKTTYVFANEYIELKEGDVIMMGNRKFIFTT